MYVNTNFKEKHTCISRREREREIDREREGNGGWGERERDRERVREKESRERDRLRERRGENREMKRDKDRQRVSDRWRQSETDGQKSCPLTPDDLVVGRQGNLEGVAGHVGEEGGASTSGRTQHAQHVVHLLGPHTAVPHTARTRSNPRTGVTHHLDNIQ